MIKSWERSPGAPYMRGVLDGSIDVCESIRQAVQRAVRDHETGPDRGLIFKPGRARYVIEYAKLCRLTSGYKAGKPFVHLPWQEFITSELFGWYWRETDKRRFRIVFITVPKKNGKSPYLAMLGLAFFHAERRTGANVYSLASKKDQAKIIFQQACNFVRQSKELRAEIRIILNEMQIMDKFSKFQPLSSDVDTIDGLEPYVQLVDELHRHKSRALWDLTRNAMQSNDESVIIAITTSGEDVTSVCHEEYEYAMNVLNGVVTDDQYLAYVAKPDEDYDYNDARWLWKLNPSMGHCLIADDVLKSLEKEKQRGGVSSAFRRFRYNEWVKESKSWIKHNTWKANFRTVDPEILKEHPCYGGLDLAYSVDMTAFSLVWEIGELLVIKVWYWCCEQSVLDRTHLDRLPYDQWVQRGALRQTPGAVTDFNFIERDILEICKIYQMIELGYDPYRATQVASNLDNAGMHVVQVRQGTVSLNNPMEHLFRCARQKNICHFNNPILSWNVQNVVIRHDKNKMIAPDKDKQKEKIDGVASTLNAIFCLLKHKAAKKEPDFSMPLVISMH